MGPSRESGGIASCNAIVGLLPGSKNMSHVPAICRTLSDALSPFSRARSRWSRQRILPRRFRAGLV